MARSATDERIIDLPIELIIGRMRTVGSESNFALRSENPTPTGVWFRVHHGASMASWGLRVRYADPAHRLRQESKGCQLPL